METVLANTAELHEKMTAAEQERKAIAGQLNDYRGRLNRAAIKRPEIIESRANDAFANVLRELAAATGSEGRTGTD